MKLEVMCATVASCWRCGIGAMKITAYLERNNKSAKVKGAWINTGLNQANVPIALCVRLIDNYWNFGIHGYTIYE